MKRYCLLFQAVIAMLAGVQASAQCDLPGYTFLGKYNGHSYYVSHATSGWSAAHAAAAALGGYLAAIGDEFENAWLADALDGQEAWIGLTDEADEGQFTWTTGEPFAYSNWAAGEPNNLGNEDFVEINRFGLGHWNDMPGWVDYLQAAVEFGDADCDGVTDECDVCDGGDDSGPCDASTFPGLSHIPADWLCHANEQKVYVCHNGNTICVNDNAAQAHLDHGDFLGPCSGCVEPRTVNNLRNLSMAIYPNPAVDRIHLDLRGIDGEAVLLIYDPWGRVVYKNSVVADEYDLRLSIDRFTPGEHYVRVMSGKQTVVKTLMIVR